MNMSTSDWIALTGIGVTVVAAFIIQWITAKRRQQERLEKFAEDIQAKREVYRAQLDLRINEVRQELENKIEAARRLSHDYGNRSQSAYSEALQRMTDMQSQFISRDEFDAHMETFGKRINQLDENIRHLTDRIDRFISINVLEKTKRLTPQ